MTEFLIVVMALVSITITVFITMLIIALTKLTNTKNELAKRELEKRQQGAIDQIINKMDDGGDVKRIY